MVKNFRLITNNFWSDGGGRYLFGQAPDLVVRADGSVSPSTPAARGGIRGHHQATSCSTPTMAASTSAAMWLSMPTAQAWSVMGYTGSANSQNRAIQELTFGFNQTIWKDAKYGADQLHGPV